MVGKEEKRTGEYSSAIHIIRFSEAATDCDNQVKNGLILNVVVGESSVVPELLSIEDQALLAGRDALLVLNLGLHVVNGVRWLDLEGDSLVSERLEEDLHATEETDH